MKNWKSVLRTAAAALLSLSIIITGISIPAKAEEPTSDENRSAGTVVTGLKGIPPLLFAKHTVTVFFIFSAPKKIITIIIYKKTPDGKRNNFSLQKKRKASILISI